MRAADIATFVRVALVIAIIYLVIIKFYPYFLIFLLAIAFLLDAVDGFFAVRESSKGKVSFVLYVKAAMGNHMLKQEIKKYKEETKKYAKYGARMDIAGDRAVEYSLWIAFTYLHIIPLFVLLIVILRHSFVDAFMAAKGTSSKLKTKFAKAVYSSNIGRGGINIVKFATFSYLILVYATNAPISIGYILVTILLFYILLRGAAEVYESLKS
ncbi:MAG: hypothetical protein ACP5RP_00600 [Candidatus Micrarchaeia archaeon]